MIFVKTPLFTKSHPVYHGIQLHLFCMHVFLLSMKNHKIVLVGAVGMSPAVLTETVWALAQENPPVIPDEVVVITTKNGCDKILAGFFDENAVWETLREKLGADDKLRFESDSSVRIISNDLREFEDIATPEENEQAADFFLNVLREYSQNPDTQIIASLAGGRKTMSALLLSCMSLLGRKNDRVCHVLANDDYIRENINFYFPKNKAEEKAAQIRLSDIPFVRISAWQNIKYAPLSYSGLVRWVNTGEFNYPKIWINPYSRELGVVGEQTGEIFGKLIFGFFYFWLKWENNTSCINWADFREYLENYFTEDSLDELEYEWIGEFERKYFKNNQFSADDETVRKRMADARKKLEELLRFPQLAKTLVPDLKKQESFSFPLENILWRKTSDVRKEAKPAPLS